MQKTSKRKRIRTLGILGISLSFFSLVIFFPSCYEPIEGCLDINSSNYDVSADGACDSCCLFPNFNLNVDQVFLGEDFSLGDTVSNRLGAEFTITDYSLIFSAFDLISDGEIFTTTDSTKVNCNGSTDNYEKDDLLFLTSTTRFATIGEWKHTEEIDNIDFLLGLNDCYHDAGINNLDEDSGISAAEALYQEGIGFKTFFIEINDSLSYEFIGKDESINIVRSIAGSNAAGSPLVFNMNIDFGIWLSDFSLEDDTETTKSKLMQLTDRAITFIE